MKNWIDRIMDEVDKREEISEENEPLVIEGYYIGGNIVLNENDIPTNEDVWC